MPSVQNTYIKQVKYDCTGLSNSNNEERISELIEMEKERLVFKNNRLVVVLKSRNSCFDNGHLIVKKGWVKDEKYEEYLLNRRSVLIAFPKDFMYRMSASLIEAFSYNKIVFGTHILLIEEYRTKYPNSCYFYSMDTFASSLIALKEHNPNAIYEYELFAQSHIDHTI